MATDSPLIIDPVKKSLQLILVFSDPTTEAQTKSTALTSITESLENITSSPHYASFLDQAIPVLLKVLRDGPPQHLAEIHAQQHRKSILELIHRLPTSDPLKPHVRDILLLMFHLLDVDNEENVLICLRIIIEMHKHYRPPYSNEVSHLCLVQC